MKKTNIQLKSIKTVGFLIILVALFIVSLPVSAKEPLIFRGFRKLVAINQELLANPNYQVFREKFIQARKRFLKDSSEGALQEFLSNGRVFLERIIDSSIDKIETIRSNVSMKEDIPSDKRSKILNDLDTQIQYLNDQKEKLAQADTAEDIREIAQGIRENVILKRKQRIQKWNSDLKSHRDKILTRFEDINKDLGQKIQELSDAGYEVANLTSLLETFSQHIQRARQIHEQIEAFIAEGQDIGENISQIQESAKEVRSELQAAQEVLKEIFDVLKVMVSS